MTSIYLTSKKRLDSRWLWITVVLIVILIIAITYIFANQMLGTKILEKKNLDAEIVKNSQSTSNSSSNSSTSESKPVDAMMSIANTSKTPSDTKASDTNMIPESNKSQNPEFTMPVANPSDKPTMTMEELINQSKGQ